MAPALQNRQIDRERPPKERKNNPGVMNVPLRLAARTRRRRQAVLVFSDRSCSLPFSVEVALGLGERVSGGSTRRSRGILLLALTPHG